MKRAIFLDRDGTINIDKNYVYKISDFEFLPGVINSLKRLYDAGYLLIIITNQSGIGRGYYTEDDFHRLNSWMISELKKYGIVITQVYYCPHLPDAPILKYRKKCNCRKPLLGMYEKAISDFNIQISNSYVIGDKFRDCSICEHMTCKGFLIGKNEKYEIINAVNKGQFKNIKYAIDLVEATNVILK
jgi:D-glycero-D-manno-heptose 1,7-bisphosphate phosphatase